MFPLFTGLNVISFNFPEDESARLGGGICVILPFLLNPPTDPQTQPRVSIMAGYIHKDDKKYDSVADFKRWQGPNLSLHFPASTQTKYFGLSPKMTLTIEETLISNTLEAYFWIHPTEPDKYIVAMRNDPKFTSVGPSEIRSQILRRISLVPCLERQMIIYPPTQALPMHLQWTTPWTGPYCLANKLYGRIFIQLLMNG